MHLGEFNLTHLYFTRIHSNKSREYTRSMHLGEFKFILSSISSIYTSLEYTVVKVGNIQRSNLNKST